MPAALYQKVFGEAMISVSLHILMIARQLRRAPCMPRQMLRRLLMGSRSHSGKQGMLY